MEILPIELVNEILSNLSYFDARNAISSSPIFYRAAVFNSSKMQKPIFDIDVAAASGEVPHSLRSFPESIRFKFKLPSDPYDYGWSVTFYKVRENDLVPQTDQNRRLLAFLRHFFDEHCQYIPEDLFCEKMSKFLQKVKIRHLHLETQLMQNTIGIDRRLREVFKDHKAQKLFYSPHNESGPEIFDCVEEVDCFDHSTLTKEGLIKLASLRRSRWVSINVDGWFDDTSLRSLGGIQQLHFRGPHRVSSPGIKAFILFWLNQATETFDKMIEVENNPDRMILATSLNGIWVGELAFDCDLNEVRPLIEGIEEPGVSVYLEQQTKGLFPLETDHTVIEHHQSFIRVFYNVPHFTSGIRLVLYKRRRS